MDVRHRQELINAGVDPSFLCDMVAAWAVAVPTGVISLVAGRVAGRTFIYLISVNYNTRLTTIKIPEI